MGGPRELFTHFPVALFAGSMMNKIGVMVTKKKKRIITIIKITVNPALPILHVVS